MKTIYTLFLLLFSTFLFGQDIENRIERVKALRIAYISDKLDLSPDEAQKFWPIYNAYDESQAELRHEKMRAILNRFKPGNVENLSEKEASALLIQMEKIEEDLFNLRRKFIKDLQGVVSAKKIIKLKKAEEDFNRELLKQMREKRKG